MTDAEIQRYLDDNGYPPHIVREGRAGLIRRWREFVEQVERGYKLGLEDYRNDLDVRAILELAGGDDEAIRALDAPPSRNVDHADHRAGMGERRRRPLLGFRLSRQRGTASCGMIFEAKDWRNEPAPQPGTIGVPMRIALAQINPVVGDLSGNRARIAKVAREAASRGAEVAVFPELSITGYPPRDLVEKPSFLERSGRRANSPSWRGKPADLEISSIRVRICGAVAIAGW